MLSYLGLRLVELGDDLVHPPGGVLDNGADGLEAALRIRDVPLSRIPDPTFFHPGSDFFPSRIPDLNFFHPGFWIPNPHSRI
jgi:hypothetical protein